MRGKISIIIAALLVAGIYPQPSFGFTNPLKSYNLYEDTHTKDSPTDNVMSEMYYTKDSQAHANSVSGVSKPVPKTVPTSASVTEDSVKAATTPKPQRRNDYLRESSKKVYGTGAGSWTQGPYFYTNPTLKAIRWKYHISNFAGCLQECQAYVQKHPSDTLGYYYLAMCYAKCGDKDNAIRAYEKVIALNSNPMIVKYATNGRNCVLGNQNDAKCFPNVNVPELKYPYREMAENADLTPVDPQTLINRNLTQLQQRLNPVSAKPENSNGENGNAQGANGGSSMPFETQDEKLDKFINAPYGSGMSPELEKEYKQQQLKNIQQKINNDDENSPGKYFQNIRYIKGFDKKSEAIEDENLKLALADNVDVESLLNNPEYIQNKKELDELKMMLGTSDSTTDITTMLPEIAKDGGNISPQVIQMMMMQSVMPNLIDIDNKNSF